MSPCFKRGVTPLMNVVDNIHLVKLLIKAGADVNAVSYDKDGKRTPLMWALTCINEDVDVDATVSVIKTLLEAGADPSVKAKDGTTVFDEARDHGNPQILKLLKDSQRLSKGVRLK